MWTPAIALVVLIVPMRDAVLSLWFMATGHVRSYDDVAFATWPALGVSMTALAIAAFLQVSVALARANGVTVRDALCEAPARLVRAWPWAIVLAPTFLLLVFKLNTSGVATTAVLSPLPFFVGIAVLPSLARGASSVEALRALAHCFAGKRIVVTVFVVPALYVTAWMAAGFALVVAANTFGSNVPAYTDPVLVVMHAAGAHACGVVFSATLVAFARSPAME
jgi:hypothetical protein